MAPCPSRHDPRRRRRRSCSGSSSALLGAPAEDEAIMTKEDPMAMIVSTSRCRRSRRRRKGRTLLVPPTAALGVALLVGSCCQSFLLEGRGRSCRKPFCSGSASSPFLSPIAATWPTAMDHSTFGAAPAVSLSATKSPSSAGKAGSSSSPPRQRGRPPKKKRGGATAAPGVTASRDEQIKTGKKTIIRTRGAAANSSAASDAGNAANIEAPSSPALAPQLNWNRKKIKGKYPVAPAYFMEDELLGHELLSMDEEQELGVAVQRAKALREALESHLEAKRLKMRRRQEKLEKQMRRRGLLEMADEAEFGVAGSDDDDPLLMRPDGRFHEEIEYDGEINGVPLPLSIYGMEALAIDDDASFDYGAAIAERRDRAELLFRQEGRRRNQEGNSVSSMAIYDGTPDDDFDGVESLSGSDSDDFQFDLDRTLRALSDDEVRTILSSALGGGDACGDDEDVRLAFRRVIVEGALARDALLRGNFRLVNSIAKKWAKQTFRGAGTEGGKRSEAKSVRADKANLKAAYAAGWGRPSLDEAIQEGILGLNRAVDKFEPERKLRFSTYATWWITNSVRACYQRATSGTIRLPLEYYNTKRKYMQLVKHYYDTEGSVPGVEVIADELGLTLSRLEVILRATQPLMSIDAPLHRASFAAPGKAGSASQDDVVMADNLMDSSEISPEDRLELSFLRQNLENAMATELAPYERDILRLRLGLDDGVSRTIREVTQEFGGALTMSEVRSREKRAYDKLRSQHTLATYQLLAYLDLAGIDKSTVTLR